MIIEQTLLGANELFQFDREVIDQVAFPLGDRYPIEIFTNYFAWYGGLAKKYKPKRILEIGVRYGYTGLVFVLGVQANRGKPSTEYIGIDDESYHQASCTKANENFKQVLPNAKMLAVKYNSFHGIPADFGTFDLIHIDGNHDYHGVANDLENCWPILNAGGIIALDDIYFPCIKEAVEDFLKRFAEDPDELVEVQWVENERGHCYLRKTA